MGIVEGLAFLIGEGMKAEAENREIERGIRRLVKEENHIQKYWQLERRARYALEYRLPHEGSEYYKRVVRLFENAGKYCEKVGLDEGKVSDRNAMRLAEKHGDLKLQAELHERNRTGFSDPAPLLPPLLLDNPFRNSAPSQTDPMTKPTFISPSIIFSSSAIIIINETTLKRIGIKLYNSSYTSVAI